MAGTTLNPIFVQARKFLEEKNFEDAISMLSELLESLVAQYGEKSLETARAYFEYGNALLTKTEDTPAEGLLGAAADDAKATAALSKILGGPDNNEVEDIIVEDTDEENEDGGEQGEDGEGDNDEGEDANDNEGEVTENNDDGNDDDDDDANQEQSGNDEGAVNDDQPQEGQNEEEVDDLEIAWELLEVARSIYEENPSPESDIRLSEVYVRIGDLQRINNLYDEALEEYKKSLTICDVICKASDRQYSDIHFAIAVTYIYKSGTENADKVKEKSSAKEHYIRAKESISLRLAELQQRGPVAASVASSSSSSSSSASGVQDSDVKLWEKEVADARELIDELTETIDALTAEIKELAASGTLDPSMGVTTIGFGTSSSSSSSSSSSAPSNFFGAASSAAPAGANFFATASSATSSANSFFQFPFAFGAPGPAVTSSTATADATGGSTLQVKRKVRPSAVPDGFGVSDVDDKAKSLIDLTGDSYALDKKQKIEG